MSMKLRGVVVGINEYKDAYFREHPLYYARQDAEKVLEVFGGSNVLHIESDRLRLLTDGKATQEEVLRMLHREVFASGLSQDEETIALFYFAGHGLIDPLEGKQIILACHDVDPWNPNTGGVRLNDIYQLVQQTSACCSIVIIDACFSGEILDHSKVIHESAAQVARRAIELTRAGPDKTIAIFTSCSADQHAREDENRKHGIYTYELLSGLRDGMACDEHGEVDIAGLAAYLSRRFEQDRQGPRSVVLSGAPVVLWRGTPRATGGDQPLPTPLITQRKLTYVGERIILPVQNPVGRQRFVGPSQEWLKAVLPLVGGVGGTMLLCGLVNLLSPAVRMMSLYGVLLLACLLPLYLFRFGRLLGGLLMAFQVLLLAGFVYQYLGWGKVPLVEPVLILFAGQLWLFWILFLGEVFLVGVRLLLLLMQPGK
jgi:hypothetical protein